MRLGLMMAVCLLAGCASSPPPVEVRTVRVEVPVQVPCKVRRVPAPAWAADGLRKTDSLETKVRALLAERLQRQGYVDQLETAVEACQ